MNRRHAALFLAGYLALVLLTPLRQLVPPEIPFPSVGILVVLYVAVVLRGSPSAGAAVAVALGYVADLAEGAPKGLSSLTFGGAYFVLRAMSGRIYLGRAASQVLTSLLLALGVGLAQSALLTATAPYGLWFLVREAFWTALATASVAPIAIGLLRRLDRRVAPEVILEGGLR